MPDEMSADKFLSLKDAKQGTEAIKNIMTETKADPQMLKFAELGDSILKNIVKIMESRKNSQSEGQSVENRGITNPNTSNIQRVQPEVIVDFKVNSAVQDLKKILAEQSLIPLDASLKDILGDVSLMEAVDKQFIQDKIKEWLMKHTEVILR